jgi:hypothetical protein
MGQLHELLAAEPDVKAAAQRALSHTINLFKSGQNKFVGHIKTYRPLDEDGEPFPDEEQPIATTVDTELSELEEAFGKWIDIAIQKETTNTVANDALNLGGVLRELPATALLNLEGKLAKLREIYAAIPTNDASRQWELDEDFGVYVSPTIVNYRTEKVPLAIVGHEGSEEHAAQVKWFNKDVRIGEWEQRLFSSMIPVAQKRQMLKRIDELIIKVKQARQRANQATVIGDGIAKTLFDYIHQDV